MVRQSILVGAFIAAVSCVALAVAGPRSGTSVSITLLATTDLHGRIEPWDYFTNTPDNLGLAKIATLVKRERARAPGALLFDVGDMVQDPQSMLTNYFLAKHPKSLNPMIAVMNHMRYDAMAVGNHEFNFAPQPMWALKGDSDFPWLCANVKQTYTHGVPYFRPYIIKTIKGVRVGIVAFVAPVAEPVAGYEFEPILPAAQRVIPELRGKVDLLVVLLHSGFVRDPVSGEQAARIQVPGENVAPELAQQVPGIDVIMYGHTHSELPEKVINGVLLTEAKFWGQSLARADVTMTRDPDGAWRVASKHSHTIPVTDEVASDPAVVQLVRPYRRELDRYLNTKIARADQTLAGRYADFEDTPLLDLIQHAEQAAGADIALASLLDTRVGLKRGPVTVGQVQALYPASNSNPIVQMTGAELKAALEHSASFYPAWPTADGQAPALPAHHPDQAAGVSYEIDLTRPVGERILDLRYRGLPVDPAQTFRVAVSAGRRLGEDGYDVYKGLPLLGQTKDMRERVVDYVKQIGVAPAQADGQWRIVPAEAAQALKTEADQTVANAR